EHQLERTTGDRAAESQCLSRSAHAVRDAGSFRVVGHVEVRVTRAAGEIGDHHLNRAGAGYGASAGEAGDVIAGRAVVTYQQLRVAAAVGGGCESPATA